MQLKRECKDGSILINYILVSLLIKLVLIKIKNMAEICKSIMKWKVIVYWMVLGLQIFPRLEIKVRKFNLTDHFQVKL